jgi:hypothetical protein
MRPGTWAGCSRVTVAAGLAASAQAAGWPAGRLSSEDPDTGAPGSSEIMNRPPGRIGGSANWRAQAVPTAYCSRVCSTTSEQLAKIGRAIDELAADSRAPQGARSDASFEDRLAGIWAMVAELDPELARRMPSYDPRARRPGPTRASGPGPDPGASGGTTRE